MMKTGKKISILFNNLYSFSLSRKTVSHRLISTESLFCRFLRNLKCFEDLKNMKREDTPDLSVRFSSIRSLGRGYTTLLLTRHYFNNRCASIFKVSRDE